MSKKLIILDRDGCINHSAKEGEYIFRQSDFVVFEDVIQTLSHPISRNFQFAVATNQQGIAKGLYSMSEVIQIHRKFLELIGRESSTVPIFVCAHRIDEKCQCRKPKPGLLLDAIQYFNLEPQDAIFIGDQESDAGAALKADVDFFLCSRIPGKELSSSFSNYRTIEKLSPDLLESLL